MSEETHAMPESRERNSRGYGKVRPTPAAGRDQLYPETDNLMEAVVERENMLMAWKKVRANGGAPGIDGVTVKELWPWLLENWPRIREELLGDEYRPQPVRGVDIPKPGRKDKRQLGIPVVLDRLIMQALNQVLQPIFDPTFSDNSYGFRPGRSAHMAVAKAVEYIRGGRKWVVDIDLERFFDQVNHDMLMARVARRVKDKRVLRLIRRFLQAGIMKEGLTTFSERGTPQGSPLSPLLSNILLDDLDKELEKRGHAFCRYADDCNIYVRTKHSGERVLRSITRFLEKKLKLKVNHRKSAVAPPSKRKFLGYSVTVGKAIKARISKESIKKFKGDLKRYFHMGRGRNLDKFILRILNPKLRGWANYYHLNECQSQFKKLDAWIRRRLRLILWRQWKTPKTRMKNLRARGISQGVASRIAYSYGPWRCSGYLAMGMAIPPAHFHRHGLISLLSNGERISR